MKYYVERQASGFVGNCLLWWRKGGHGYTCNLDDAEVFEAKDPYFQSIARDKKYRAWEKTYIDSATVRHVDHQRLNMDLAGVNPIEREAGR